MIFTDSAAFGGHGSGLRSRQAGFKAENARHSGLADRRDGAGAPCAEPAGPADAGRGLVRQCGTPFGVRCGPDNRHRAAVEKLRSAGRQILVTTVTESLGTFAVVSLVFACVFRITGVPVYLAFCSAASCWPQRPRPRFPL